MPEQIHPTIAKINRFLVKWPSAEYGPAHIILSDYNLEDHNFEFVFKEIDEAKATLEAGLRSEYVYSVTAYELNATERFLRELQAIPEDERCVWCDDEDGDDD